MTRKEEDPRRGFYGTVGTRSVIKHCRILKDVHVGSDAYIKGSNKLKNLTIHSSAVNPRLRSEKGVELVNGIIGYGCRIFYGVKAVRFVSGRLYQSEVRSPSDQLLSWEAIPPFPAAKC